MQGTHWRFIFNYKVIVRFKGYSLLFHKEARCLSIIMKATDVIWTQYGSTECSRIFSLGKAGYDVLKSGN